MPRLHLTCAIENRPLIKPFVISTGTRTHQAVLMLTLSDGSFSGRGMASGLAYRRETPDVLLQQIEAVREEIEAGLDRSELAQLSLAGGSRFALDSALWELEAARSSRSVATLLGLEPKPLASAFTIVLDDPDVMASQALQESWRPLLKVKLGGSPDQEMERIRAVAKVAPSARRVIDANAAWTPDLLKMLAPIAAAEGYELLEQPLPMGCEDDPRMQEALKQASQSIPLCADESFQKLTDLDRMADFYQVLNIKLDKCGGLTEGMRLRHAAREKGLGVFVGCMLAPTEAIAPAFLLAQTADYVDLDGPFWFPNEPAELNDAGYITPINETVWGRGVSRSS